MAARLHSRAVGPTSTVIHTVVADTAKPPHAVAAAAARGASTSLPARAATVRRADTRHLTATATVLVIGAQAGSTNPLRAPLRAAIAQVAPPLATAPIASAQPRRPRRLLVSSSTRSLD